VLLLVLNALVFLLTLGDMLFWEPLGIYYTVLQAGDDPHRITHEVYAYLWAMVGPLLFINLCWIAYAVFPSRGPRPSVVLPLPDDAGERFKAPATQIREGPPPQVRPGPDSLGHSS
jgi:hypothetical protein